MARNVVALEDRGNAEYVTNWSAVYLASGIGALCLVGVVAAVVVAACQPETPRSYSFTLPMDTARDATRIAALRTIDVGDDLAPLPQDSGVHFPVPSPRRAVQHAMARGTSVALQMSHWRWRPALAAANLAPSLRALLEVKETPTPSLANRITSDNDLYNYLWLQVPEVNLDSTEGTTQKLFASSDIKEDRPPITTAEARDDEEALAQFTERHSDSAHRHSHLAMLESLAAERSDLRGLPLRQVGECVTPLERAKQNQEFTRTLRQIVASGSDEFQLRRRPSRSSPYENYTPSAEDIAKSVLQHAGENKGNQVSIIEQILQPESSQLRGVLVCTLAQIPGQEATAAIARRALFDVDHQVRKQAVSALASRPSEEVQAALEAGLRHPLAPARANALLALSRPHPEQAAPAMDAPARHISLPYPDADDSLVVDELVKVNHLRNCVLCHPKSAVSENVLRGQIPTPGQELPRIYYNSKRGNFVRADIVYLRQDFSLNLPVTDAKPWPNVQRYDFFVRTRPATDADFDRDREQLRQANAAARNRIAAALRGTIAEAQSWLAVLNMNLIASQSVN